MVGVLVRIGVLHEGQDPEVEIWGDSSRRHCLVFD